MHMPGPEFKVLRGGLACVAAGTRWCKCGACHRKEGAGSRAAFASQPVGATQATIPDNRRQREKHYQMHAGSQQAGAGFAGLGDGRGRGARPAAGRVMQILNIPPQLTQYMAKVKRVSGRGTSVREADSEDQNWAGDAYRKKQAERRQKAGNATVSTRRGTGKTKLKDIPEPKARKSTEGRTRVTARGTGTRKSRNRGG